MIIRVSFPFRISNTPIHLMTSTRPSPFDLAKTRPSKTRSGRICDDLIGLIDGIDRSLRGLAIRTDSQHTRPNAD